MVLALSGRSKLQTNPDCKLGVGHNANMLISDIYAKSPEYLNIVYKTYNLPDEVMEVVSYYINLDKKEKKEMAKKEAKKEVADITSNFSDTLLSKINSIRKAWKGAKVEKEGKGKAGGGAKYDYYKPQQIIDFCLEQELKYNLFSEFKITQDGFCSYILIDIPTGEARSVECPFDIPRKMAASEAQQVGAAMTYHNRRLAMMMYKIEDNSKESEDVLSNADFSAQNIPAPPVIPAPPTMAKEDVNVAPIPPVATDNQKVEESTPPINVEPQTSSSPVPPVANGPKAEAVESPQAGNKNVTSVPPKSVPAPRKMPDMSCYGNGAEQKVESKPVKSAETKTVNGNIPYIDPSSVMSKPAKKSIEALYE